MGCPTPVDEIRLNADRSPSVAAMAFVAIVGSHIDEEGRCLGHSTSVSSGVRMRIQDPRARAVHANVRDRLLLVH